MAYLIVGDTWNCPHYMLAQSSEGYGLFLSWFDEADKYPLGFFRA